MPNFLAYLNFGLCLIQRKKFRDSEKILRQAVEKCGQMWELNLILGVVLSELGRHKEAIEALVSTLEPNSRSQMYFPFRRKLWEIWDLIAAEFAAIGDRSSAFAAWTRAAELAPDAELQKRYMTMAQSVASPVDNSA